jgi:hypothetical protein
MSSTLCCDNCEAVLLVAITCGVGQESPLTKAVQVEAEVTGVFDAGIVEQLLDDTGRGVVHTLDFSQVLDGSQNLVRFSVQVVVVAERLEGGTSLGKA